MRGAATCYGEAIARMKMSARGRYQGPSTPPEEIDRACARAREVDTGWLKDLFAGALGAFATFTLRGGWMARLVALVAEIGGGAVARAIESLAEGCERHGEGAGGLHESACRAAGTIDRIVAECECGVQVIGDCLLEAIERVCAHLDRLDPAAHPEQSALFGQGVATGCALIDAAARAILDACADRDEAVGGCLGELRVRGEKVAVAPGPAAVDCGKEVSRGPAPTASGGAPVEEAAGAVSSSGPILSEPLSPPPAAPAAAPSAMAPPSAVSSAAAAAESGSSAGASAAADVTNTAVPAESSSSGCDADAPAPPRCRLESLGGPDGAVAVSPASGCVIDASASMEARFEWSVGVDAGVCLSSEVTGTDAEVGACEGAPEETGLVPDGEAPCPPSGEAPCPPDDSAPEDDARPLDQVPEPAPPAEKLAHMGGHGGALGEPGAVQGDAAGDTGPGNTTDAAAPPSSPPADAVGPDVSDGSPEDSQSLQPAQQASGPRESSILQPAPPQVPEPTPPAQEPAASASSAGQPGAGQTHIRVRKAGAW